MATDGMKKLDYAIVGGGIAGIYSAWRLLNDTAGKKPTVGLFESSGRLGGRLLSVVPPLISDARVELGGMRYIEDVQPWVTCLVEYLNLETENLPADQPQNIAYVRRKMLRMFELTDASKVPYDLKADESSPDDLANLTAVAAIRALKATIYDLLGLKISTREDLSKLSPDDWEKVAKEGTYEGRPLYELPLRYLMMRSISHEAFDMAKDTSGYDSILYTWNGADGFSWNLGDYGPGVKYLHVKEGYDRLPLTLAEQFEKGGGAIHLGHRLTSFTADKHDGPVTLKFDAGATTRTVTADALILAMPRRSLELLDQTGPVLGPGNDHVHDLIRSVTPIPLFKLAICYEFPWWEKLPPVETRSGMQRITSGKSVTDLPVRQCYYWKVDEKTNHAVILIYDDGLDLEYWAGLRDSTSKAYPNDPELLPDEFNLPEWKKFPAPERMVNEAHRQLVELHGNPVDVPKPYTAAYRDWGEDPFGGGANFWPVGVQSYKVSKDIIQPKPPYSIYICGDAYSHAQGWVEGALHTAEEMLQDHLHLTAPAWKTGVISGINHINVVVKDLKAAQKFFVENFGFTAGEPKVLKGAWVDKLNRYKNARATYVPLKPKGGGANTTNIELLTFAEPASPPPGDGTTQLNMIGYRHIGFAVDNIDVMYGRLKTDWEFLSEPVYVRSMDLKTVYFHGPEGIVIQLTQYNVGGKTG